MSEWRRVLYWARPVEHVQHSAFHLMFVVYIAKKLETLWTNTEDQRSLVILNAKVYDM